MSAESEIADILNRASSDAFFMASAADRAVIQAVKVIDQEFEWEDFDAFDPKEEGVSGVGEPKDRESKTGNLNASSAFRFPSYPFLRLVTPPALQAAIPPPVRRLPDAPVLTLPAIAPPEPAVVPPFSASLPETSASDFTLPAIPDTALPDAPAFLEFPELNIPELQLPFLELLPPPPVRPLPVEIIGETVGGIQDLIFHGPGGLTELLAQYRKDSEGANEFLALVLGASGINPTLTNNGLDAAAQEAVDRIDRMLARLDHWPLPAASKAAILTEVERLAARWRSLAAGAVAADGQARALDYQAAARDALTGFARKAQELQGLEIELALKAHAFAGRYAKRLIGVLLDVHDAQYAQQYDSALQQAEAALAGHEARLTVGLLELELAEARIERGKSLQTRNTDALQRYEVEAREGRNQVAIYAALVSAARKERDLKKLPYEQWALQLKAADQLTEADMAYADLAKAELAGDQLTLEAAKAKIALYQEQARAYSLASQAKQDAAQIVEINNEALVSEYRAKIKALLLQREQEVSREGYQLDQRIAVIERYLDQARIDIEELAATREFETKRTEGELKEYEISVDRINALTDAEAERLRGMAELHLTGSEITARLAESAASQVTRLVEASVREF